ncbi:MAG: TlpA family protein disulfide reductase [Hyphomicrobiales bacterium]|nr:TlpA family protein disulfide reductase [Hyphomicrobiales bacterium]
MSDGKKSWPAARIVATLIALCIIVAGFALYVTQRPSGNKPDEVARDTVSAPDGCAAKTDEAKKLAAVATGSVAAMAASVPPVSLAGLSFNGPDGKPLKLADFKGKTVLMNLWATWCAPCRAEMPELDTLEKEKGGTGFEVVAVNADTGSDEKPKKFLAETGATTLAYYSDHTMGLFNELKDRGLALGLPVTLLIDKDGCLMTHMNGPAAWASAEAKTFIDAAGG